MKLIAISGWAVPAEWFQQLIAREIPGVRSKAIYPHTGNNYSDTVKFLKENPADIYLGYSLGSLWLSKHGGLVPEGSLICHLAPILAYPRESMRGGKIAKGRLDYLKKWIHRHPDSSELVREFLESNQIKLTQKDLSGLPDSSQLISGLDYLIQESVDNLKDKNAIFLIGEKDPLLSYECLKKEIMDLVVIENENHNPVPLLRALWEQKRFKEYLQTN